MKRILLVSIVLFQFGFSKSDSVSGWESTTSTTPVVTTSTISDYIIFLIH
jgi:hypothetical protein